MKAKRIDKKMVKIKDKKFLISRKKVNKSQDLMEESQCNNIKSRY